MAETTETTATTKRTRRVFLHGTMRLTDPDPNMTQDQVKAHYAATYGDLTNATVALAPDKGRETDTFIEQVYEFKRAVGTKG